MNNICVLTFLCLLVQATHCSRILGFFTTPSLSHQKVFQGIWKELALKGHNVTVVSPNILNDKSIENLTEIDVSYVYGILKNFDPTKILSKDVYSFERVLGCIALTRVPTELILEDARVQELLRHEEFDIMIVQAMHPLTMALAARFKIPVIGISSYGVLLNMHDVIGNPTHPVISPDLMFTYDDDMNFWVRVNSFLYNFWYRMLYYWYELPLSDKIARKYFGDDMPYLGDLVKNVSLLMVNVNPILNPVRANVPNIIEMNQIHIKKSKPLPEDIKQYLDSSPNGVVYFSLGSNIKSSNLPLETRKEILGALSELPYNVLWKWETDHLPGQPKNVLVRKWLPQQDILGHPNIKVFITQGGLQSAEETIVKGVPIVGIPFIADQPRNVQTMVEKGLGLRVDVETLTKDTFKDAILEVAENKKYKDAVMKAKRILEDQPLKGLDKAIWWIEYVIRHGDVSHLRSSAADMSFFEYFMLDVVLFLSLALIVISYLSVKFVVFTWRRSKFSKKLKTN